MANIDCLEAGRQSTRIQVSPTILPTIPHYYLPTEVLSSVSCLHPGSSTREMIAALSAPLSCLRAGWLRGLSSMISMVRPSDPLSARIHGLTLLIS